MNFFQTAAFCLSLGGALTLSAAEYIENPNLWQAHPAGKLRAEKSAEKYQGRPALLFNMPEPSGHIGFKMPMGAGEEFSSVTFSIKALPGCVQKEVLFLLPDQADGERYYFAVKHSPEWKTYTAKRSDFRILTWPGQKLVNGKLDDPRHLRILNSPRGQKFLLADLSFRFEKSGSVASAKKPARRAYKFLPYELPRKYPKYHRYFPEAQDLSIRGDNFIRNGKPTFPLGAWQLDVETASWLMRLDSVELSIFNAAEIYSLYTPWVDPKDGKLVLNWKENPWFEGIIARLLRNKVRFWQEHKAHPRSGELPKFREFDDFRGAGHFVAYDPYHPDGEKAYLEMYKSWIRHTRKFPIFCYELFNEMMYDNTHFSSRRAFAEAMRKKYHGSMDAANRAWGTRFPGWAEVNPPGFVQDGGLADLPRESLFRREARQYPNLTADWRKFQETRGGAAIGKYMKLMRNFDPDPKVFSTSQCHLSLPDDYGSAGLNPEGVRNGSDFYSHEVGVPFVESNGYFCSAFASAMLKPLFGYDMLYQGAVTDIPIYNAESGMHVSTRGAGETEVLQETLVDLHKNWKFFDATSALPENWWKNNFDDRAWKPVKVPGMWAESGFKMCQVGLYRLHFPASGALLRRDGKLYLNGKSFADKADIYLNGEKLGSVKGHSESCTFEITGKLKADNVLAAVLENHYFLGGAYYGGIRGFVSINPMPLVLKQTYARDRRHLRSFLWSQAVHGMRGVMLSYEDAFYAPESRIIPQIHAAIESAMPFLGDRSTHAESNVGVIWNQETLRSLEHRDYIEQVSGPGTRDLMGYYGALLFEHYEPKVLRNKDLLRKNPDVKALILGDNIRIPAGVLPALEKFVRAGGIAIVSGNTLRIDDDTHAVLNPSFLTGLRITGVEKRQRRAVLPGIGSVLLPVRFVDGISGIRAEKRSAEDAFRFADGSCAVAVNSVGKGKVYTLAANFAPPVLREIIRKILEENKIFPVLKLKRAGGEKFPEYVDSKLFTDGKGRMLLYLNNMGPSGSVSVPLNVKGDSTIRNIENNRTMLSPCGKTIWTSGELKSGLPVRLEQYSPAIFLIENAESVKMPVFGISPIRHKMLSELWKKTPEKKGRPTVGITAVFGGLLKVHGVIPTARRLLTDNGFNVREIKPGDSLKGIDVLFYQSLRLPCDEKGVVFSKPILDFVRGGGSLLIGHSAELNHHTSSHSRPLTRALGLDYDGFRRNVLYNWTPKFPDEDNLNVTCRDFTDHPAARFVKTFVSAGAGCLNKVPKGGKVILSSPAKSTLKGKPMIVEIPYGKGRVIFMSDHWYLRPLMLEQGDNAQLFYNLICFLAGRKIERLTPEQLEKSLFISRRKMAEAEEQEKKGIFTFDPVPSGETYLDIGKDAIRVMGHGDPVIDILRQF